MQYSGTFSANAATAARAVPSPDPISDARELLRRAARLPFAASHPLAWSSRFTQLVADARSSIRQHITRSGRPDSPMARIEREEPRLRAVIERQREEHAELTRQIEDLYTEANMSGKVDIWRMIELGERAILLEMALARHHNRLAQLVYETTNRELAGEAT
jgi:predicted RNase H-like nuclease (RuvC/YqgF family)